jgi:hypothetical protein
MHHVGLFDDDSASGGTTKLGMPPLMKWSYVDAQAPNFVLEDLFRLLPQH